MAMSRSFGGILFTTRPPMRISPAVIFSRPASMRSNVDLPQPEGPTRITNSPSAISMLTPLMMGTAPKDFRTLIKSTGAIHILPDQRADRQRTRPHVGPLDRRHPKQMGVSVATP